MCLKLPDPLLDPPMLLGYPREDCRISSTPDRGAATRVLERGRKKETRRRKRKKRNGKIIGERKRKKDRGIGEEDIRGGEGKKSAKEGKKQARKEN